MDIWWTAAARRMLRRLLRRPGFTLSALLTLALGIGATTAIFTVVTDVLLRPLPYREDGRLVRIFTNFPDAGLSELSLSPGEYVDVRARSRSLEMVAAFREGDFTVNTGDRPRRLAGAIASASLALTLGVRPIAGRWFLPPDDEAGGEPAVVISHGLWMRELGADPDILGKTIALDRVLHTVVGIMPPGFDYPAGAELWTPLALTAHQLGDAERGSRFLRAVGRLAPGESVASAMRDLNALVPRFAEEHPSYYEDSDFQLSIVGMRELMVGDVRASLLIIFAVVGLVLIIACANVANLMLARAMVRRRDTAVRSALGASRARLYGEAIGEGLMLALGGGALGVLLAAWGLDILVSVAPPDFPRLADIAIDPRVLGFTAAVVILAGTLSAWLPARHGARLDPAGELRSANLRTTGRRGERRAGSALVVGQMAITLALLIGAGLLLRSLLALRAVDAGLDADDVLTARVALPSSQYVELEKVIGFYHDLLDRLASLPGVESAGAAAILPGTGSAWDVSFEIPGRETHGAAPDYNAQYRPVTPGFFSTLRTSLVRGRILDAGDRAERPLVAVVNETFVRRYFPTEDPIGGLIRLPLLGIRKDAHERRIVGVIRDLRQSLDREPLPSVYVPHDQQPVRGMAMLIRTGAEPATAVAPLRESVRALDPELPLYAVRSMAEVLGESTAQRRFNTLLIGLFAVTALLLAMVGLYGVISFIVGERAREFGIRMALGATRREVMGAILHRGASLAALGGAIGLGLALVASRTLSGLLYEVKPADPAILVSVSLLLILVATLASYLPARRAARLNPMTILREE